MAILRILILCIVNIITVGVFSAFEQKYQYAGLSIRGDKRYFYLPKMVFGTSSFQRVLYKKIFMKNAQILRKSTACVVQVDLKIIESPEYELIFCISQNYISSITLYTCVYLKY